MFEGQLVYLKMKRKCEQKMNSRGIHGLRGAGAISALVEKEIEEG